MQAAAALISSSERDEPFDAHYRRHFRQVYLQCLRYAAGDAAWAEDVAHDVFLKLLERGGEVDAERVAAWLYRVAANTAVSHLRRKRWWLGWLREAAARGDDPAPSPGELLDQRRRNEAALATLRALPGRERVVVCMKVLEGRSQREIAETLALSEGYVSKLLQRALARLKSAGWELDDG